MPTINGQPVLQLEDFVRESNRIERIYRDPTPQEITATREFLKFPLISVASLEGLISIYAPGHQLRDKLGLNVRIGYYLPPAGGPEIREALEDLLALVRLRKISAYRAHVEYEMLHPFTDGNGRSGRALWAWDMYRRGADPFTLGFLHNFYYQTLQAQQKPG